MTQCNTSADDTGVVSPDRVRAVVQGLLRAAQQTGLTDDQLEAMSGIKARRIKSYRVEGKEPSLSAALSLAVALGPTALNGVLAIIGYSARSLGEPDEKAPMQIVANGMKHFAIIANAAADNRIDHTEERETTAAADALIAEILPLSSAGKQ